MNTLRIGCTVLPTVLDRDQPRRILQWENIDAHLQLYEALTAYAGAPPETAGSPASLALQPFVAERWERSADATVYRFVLRRGIWSAFGHELAAEDVRWTWERSLALGTVGAWIGGNAGLRSADQVRAVDRYVVEFHLPYPTTILPHLLAVIVPTLFDAQEARRHATPGDPWALARLRSHGAGYGPYVVDEAAPAGSFRLAANPRYWRGRLPFEAVELVAIADPDARWAALRRGEVDAATELEVPAGRRDGGVTVYHVPTTWRTMLGLTYERPPFDRAAVRQAIAQAIPYDRLIAEACRGRAQRMTSCISDVVLGHAPVEPRWEHRPDEARRLLRPYLPLSPLKLVYHEEFPEFPAMARLIAEALEAVGIAAEPQAVDAAEHGMRKLARALDLFLDADGPITIDGRYALGHDVNPPPGGVFDFVGYHNAEVDRLLRASLVELDDARMRALLADVQRITLHDLPWIPLAQQTFCFGLRDAVGGYRWYPLPRLRCRDLAPRG
ncbi:MAG: hypothetical protein HY691_14745 [Chloroflexi bacterium]|nr:hypothetical protein [Chloroflexota bacterium]